jgi:hypothetical protein
LVDDDVDSDATMTNREKSRTDVIKRAIADRNLEALRILSVRGGLETSALRCEAWPLLLGLRGGGADESWESKNYKVNLYRHKDYDQVMLDVARSLWRFTASDAERDALREQLATVLHCVLCNHPYLSYFQGMHDIASALLLVFRSERITYFALERLCMFHIRDACARSLDEIQSVLWLLFPLLKLLDRDVDRFMRQAHSMGSLTMPIFALPWVLTLYSHSLDNLGTITRLLDFFIVSHPLMPLYFAAQLICYLKTDLFALECDFMHVMKFLGTLPEDRLPFDDLIVAANACFERYPPAKLLRLAEHPIVVMPSMLKSTHHFPDALHEMLPAPWPSERHYARYLAKVSSIAPRYVEIDGVTDDLRPRRRNVAEGVGDAVAFALLAAAFAGLLIVFWLPKYLAQGGASSFTWLQPHGRVHGCE